MLQTWQRLNKKCTSIWSSAKALHLPYSSKTNFSLKFILSRMMRILALVLKKNLRSCVWKSGHWLEKQTSRYDFSVHYYLTTKLTLSFRQSLSTNYLQRNTLVLPCSLTIQCFFRKTATQCRVPAIGNGEIPHWNSWYALEIMNISNII